MSFSHSPQTDLDKKPERIAEYTWGEESYDGLGDALQEGGDELNDETFGGVSTIGKAEKSSSFVWTHNSCVGNAHLYD